jgi:transposase
VKGRKIHALVDSEGRPMRADVHSAAIWDRHKAGLILDKIRRRCPRLELMWAEGGYNAWQVEATVAKEPRLPWRSSSGATTPGAWSFCRAPGVERTFSWFGRNRRPAKNFENLAETLTTCVALAHPAVPSGGLPGRRSRPTIHHGDWGVDLVEPAPGSLAQLFARPVLEAAITVVAAWVLWTAIGAIIDEKMPRAVSPGEADLVKRTRLYRARSRDFGHCCRCCAMRS